MEEAIVLNVAKYEYKPFRIRVKQQIDFPISYEEFLTNVQIMRTGISNLKSFENKSKDEIARFSDMILFACDCNESYIANDKDFLEERSRIVREICLTRLECLARGVISTISPDNYLVFMDFLSKSCHFLLKMALKPRDLWVDQNVAAYIWRIYVSSEVNSLDLFSRNDTNEKVAEIWQDLINQIYETIIDIPEIRNTDLFVYICAASANSLVDSIIKGDLGNKKVGNQQKDSGILFKNAEDILRSAFLSKNADTISLMIAVKIWNRLQIAKGQPASSLDTENLFLGLTSQLDLPPSFKGNGLEQSLVDGAYSVFSSYGTLPTIFHLELSIKVARQLSELNLLNSAFVMFEKSSDALSLFEKIPSMEQVSCL